MEKYASPICQDELSKLYISLLDPINTLKVKSESLKLFPIFESYLSNHYKDQVNDYIFYLLVTNNILIVLFKKSKFFILLIYFIA